MGSVTNHRHRQDGAVIVTTALVLLFLLGFMGIALDFGRLFVVKTELQTAMDSCALAAAQELDTASDAIIRAISAGKTAGNMNKVHFQSSSAGIVDSEITFSDTLNGTYSNSFPFATAKYAKCTHTKSGMTPWLLQSMSAFTGNNSYAANQGVYAFAVATRASAQSSCAIPVQINPKGTGPNFGFTPGEWIPSLYDEGSGNSDTTPGHFGWANLNGSSSATDTKNQLLGTGVCNLHVDDTSTPGAKFGASTAWNSRFGLYKNGAGNPDLTSAPPDLTGYSYTAKNWPPVSPATLPSNALPDFLAKRATHSSYGNTADSVDTGDTITGLNMKGGYKDTEMATYAAGPRALSSNGKDRRLVLAPIVTGTKIVAFACILMLHPIDSVNTTVYLEYVGNAASSGSPCTSLGLAGGTGGPLVPVLVQ
jgi:hypothetical protein